MSSYKVLYTLQTRYWCSPSVFTNYRGSELSGASFEDDADASTRGRDLKWGGRFPPGGTPRFRPAKRFETSQSHIDDEVEVLVEIPDDVQISIAGSFGE
jgi:hypothetical protein